MIDYKQKFLELAKEIKIALRMEEASDVKLTEATLQDGTIIVYDKLETGSTITSQDGTKLAAGDYILEDGKTIKVTEEGIIDTITESSEEEMSDDKEKISLTESKLKNGIIIKFEELMVGNKINISNDGTEISLPGGLYELEDGTIIVVDYGSISAIIGKSTNEPTTEPATEPMPETQMNSELNDLFDIVKSLTEKTTNLSKQVEEIAMTPSAEKFTFNSEKKELTDLQKFMLEIKNKK